MYSRHTQEPESSDAFIWLIFSSIFLVCVLMFPALELIDQDNLTPAQQDIIEDNLDINFFEPKIWHLLSFQGKSIFLISIFCQFAATYLARSYNVPSYVPVLFVITTVWIAFGLFYSMSVISDYYEIRIGFYAYILYVVTGIFGHIQSLAERSRYEP